MHCAHYLIECIQQCATFGDASMCMCVSVCGHCACQRYFRVDWIILTFRIRFDTRWADRPNKISSCIKCELTKYLTNEFVHFRLLIESFEYSSAQITVIHGRMSWLEYQHCCCYFINEELRTPGHTMCNGITGNVSSLVELIWFWTHFSRHFGHFVLSKKCIWPVRHARRSTESFYFTEDRWAARHVDGNFFQLWQVVAESVKTESSSSLSRENLVFVEHNTGCFAAANCAYRMTWDWHVLSSIWLWLKFFHCFGFEFPKQ